MYGQLSRLHGLLLQRSYQVAIKFNDMQPPGCLQQRQRNGALAGPDFDQGVICMRVDCHDNPVDDSGVMQEMLAETFTRCVWHGALPARYGTR